MVFRCIPLLSATVLALIAQAVTVFAQEATLPGGAASLRETHGDWTVACVLQTADGKKRKVCALTQEQVAAKTRQRALALDLKPDGTGIKGALILPFGLALEKGASFVLDEGKPGGVQRFRTCLPVGCLINIAFDGATVTALKSGKALSVKVVADNGKEMILSISLAGFAGAYDRVAALIK
jgi:invasion protein IalB